MTEPLAIGEQDRKDPRRNKKRRLRPEDYAAAVNNYAQLPGGVGQNYVPLARFLVQARVPLATEPTEEADDVITVYPLGNSDTRQTPQTPSFPQGSSDDEDELEEMNRSRHSKRPQAITFCDPDTFYRHSLGQGPQSRIIFLSGFLTPAWMKSIGARYTVDPEFFCRHMNFHYALGNSNNCVLPGLPSSSAQSVELPIITIGRRQPLSLKSIKSLREEGVINVHLHHHNIWTRGLSLMKAGQQMVREYYVFDQEHFVIEEQISVHIQVDKKRKIFNLFVWLDSGTESDNSDYLPWEKNTRDRSHLPIQRHRSMSVFRYAFPKPFDGQQMENPRYQEQSAAQIPLDYGRSLHPAVMAQDAFYCLAEIFQTSATSINQLLNLIDTNSDWWTQNQLDLRPRKLAPDQDALPELKETKSILYHQAKKIKAALESIENAKLPLWPKDESEDGSRKARIKLESIERDFKHLLDRSEALHNRATEAITVLMSTMSISESRKAIQQTERVSKLTFLAFVFVPLSFTTSFFGMNVKQLGESDLGIHWWFVLSVPITVMAVALYFIDVSWILPWVKTFVRKITYY